jgi:hypothetical protein
MKSYSNIILRLLLVVLLGTFMAPGFAWQMIDSHSEETDVPMANDAGHHERGSGLLYHHHHHDDGDDDEDMAHTQIGHLMGHMPAVIYETGSLPIHSAQWIAYPDYCLTFALVGIAPPFKPPRIYLFV